MIRIYRGLLEEDDARPENELRVLPRGGLVRDARPLLREDAALQRRRLPLDRAEASRLFRRVAERRRSKRTKQHAEQLLELDAKVAEAVAKLKAKGFVSPYLKAFVVARINPLRWIQGEPPPLEEVLKTMRERAAKFNVDKIKQEDLAVTAAARGTTPSDGVD